MHWDLFVEPSGIVFLVTLAGLAFGVIFFGRKALDALDSGIAMSMSGAEYRRGPMSGLYWLTTSLQIFNSLACLALALALVYFAVWLLGSHGGEGRSPVNSEIAALGCAVESYKADLGDYPSGDNAAIFKVLTGGNLDQKVYFEANKNQISPRGEVIDPWGTPYRFYRSGDFFNIRSAGPNRKFGDQDDATTE